MQTPATTAIKATATLPDAVLQKRFLAVGRLSFARLSFADDFSSAVSFASADKFSEDSV